MLPHDQEVKSDIVLDTSLIKKVKSFATHNTSQTNLSEYAVLVYYEIIKHVSNYDIIDLVFDQYF